tara:strand:- start:175 stop:357 length:183 start_codon:yes stop_codon:yes gene_type:complete
MPWLIYNKQRSATKILENSGRIKFRASFNIEALGIMQKLRLKLAKYDLLGNFLGFENLTD